MDEETIRPFELQIIVFIKPDVEQVHQRIATGFQESADVMEKWLVLVDRNKHEFGLDHLAFLCINNVESSCHLGIGDVRSHEFMTGMPK